MPRDANGLTPKQARFVQEYLIDLNATQAAIRSGYSERNAGKIGPRLVGQSRIAAAIQAKRQTAAAKADVTVQWVLDRLRENVERAMRTIPVYEMRDGQRVETGEYQYEGAVANKALELIGKHLGAFPERVEIADLAALSEQELEKVAQAARTKLRLVA